MKLLFCFFFTAINAACFSQTYLSLAPSLTNTAGTFAQKGNIAFEAGQQWDVFSLGIDLGRTNFSQGRAKDTSTYIELRPNLNVFQQGRFTNTFTAGIGFIFNAKENLVTELTNGIEYAFTTKLHFNVFFGQYFYSGRYSASDATFFGVSAAFYFNETTAGGLIKKAKQ